ncbi:PLP-dependent cysteine synthase family protein [Allofournierella sp.]|uniref:PLP-dependent cysteine synthase family protein n=1 Tax=Allofournierella sp. TaxID=1940256 RepID=UPI003AB76C42
MPVLKSYYQALYGCPVVELSGYTAHCGLSGRILAYLDFGGATGSAKDGLAEGMLALAAQRGQLAPGQPVVEAGGGTFSAALCIAARRSGHPVLLAVTPTLEGERQKFLQRLGARLVFSMDALQGRKKLWALARQTAEEQGGYYLDHFNNDDNPEYHRRVTGPAILKATGGGEEIDAIVAGVGSGGTLTGVGEHVKAWTNHIRIVAVEPYESQAIGGGFVGRHGIPGLGAGFVPQNYNPYIVDKVLAVPSGEALRASREVLRTDGVPACPSAGAALFAARQLLEKGKSKSVLCVFSGRQMYE